MTLGAVCVSVLVANGATAQFADTREWLVHFDPWLISFVAFPLYVIVLPLLVWMATNELPRKLPLVMASTAEAFWILMILCGWLCRDMFLAFSWPWERAAFKLTPLNDKNLSEMFWQQLLHGGSPEHPIAREIPGFLVILSYVLLAVLLVRCATERHLWQSTAISIMLPVFLFFPIVILLKQSCDMKYVLSFPEVFVNL